MFTNPWYLRWFAKKIGVIALATVLGSLAFAVQAGGPMDKGRNVQRLMEVKSTEIGDVDGHYVGSFESVGVTFHDNGEVSTFVSKGTFDFVKGVAH